VLKSLSELEIGGLFGIQYLRVENSYFIRFLQFSLCEIKGLKSFSPKNTFCAEA